MTIQERIILHLRTAGIVGVRVWGSTLPQGSSLPALVVQRISALPLNNTQGEGRGIMRSRIQITTFATSYESAANTAVSVISTMDSFTAAGAGGRARLLLEMELGRESESKLFQTTQDFEVLHSQ